MLLTPCFKITTQQTLAINQNHIFHQSKFDLTIHLIFVIWLGDAFFRMFDGKLFQKRFQSKPNNFNFNLSVLKIIHLLREKHVDLFIFICFVLLVESHLFDLFHFVLETEVKD